MICDINYIWTLQSRRVMVLGRFKVDRSRSRIRIRIRIRSHAELRLTVY